MSLVESPEATMLLQSNLIEGEPGLGALSAAIDAWQYLLGQLRLDHEVVTKAHGILMEARDLEHPLQPKYQGFYRNIPVYIGGHMGLHHTLIRHDMEALFEKLNDRRHQLPVSDEARAGWAKRLHVEFERIHPFVDGNGRMGRMILNWHRIRIGLPVLVINADDRAEYYKWFTEEI